MKKGFVILACIIAILVTASFSKESLRALYSKPASQWPRPLVDDAIEWQELGRLSESPLMGKQDSLKEMIELGKVLFFDPKLSGSGKISCASCHDPSLNWTDGKEKSIGHNGAVNKRNAPTIQNTWFYHRLFWDGRSPNLEDQAFAPINSQTEMNSEMSDVMRKLRKSKTYPHLFKAAFGDEGISPDRLASAIAVFERTVSSRKSKFDDFLDGNTKALTNSEVRGLHLFRTKARCMNCHYGPFFSDNKFHNIGFSATDEGYYKISHNDQDIGKFKTPSLRDVMKTGPWMHDGKWSDMDEIIEKFNTAEIQTGVTSLILPLKLTKREKMDLLAFLNSISADPLKFTVPDLPE